ncbi:isopeptide-forming domain-containing fimbrial protein [Streptococcus suis]|nr:isopeptide-forming domain-containing fimbrial protein [Streptococcus suis]RRR38142.1 isopeptide-forming domain-containing fimbrial protein [Streptococcus suis]RRR53413.1 isopeptide-forming domain-containing fimbrial protein [Streptococcus suis]RRR58536.1 isopeptide-forming domain-containing fimbrial protein [Streptococcus suis]
MSTKRKNSVFRKMTTWVTSLVTIAAVGTSVAGGSFVNAVELGNISTSTKASQEGCAIKIETTEQVEWKLPRQAIDLVILQDTSGSFENTIKYVQSALKTLTEPVELNDYNENSPRLIFTDNPATTDRVMVNSFQGIDGTYFYDQPVRRYDNLGQLVATEYPTDSNFGIHSSTNWQTNSNMVYQFKDSPLMNNKAQIDRTIDTFVTNGGTPTVPAIEDTIKKYNELKGDMTNRKTVFLLITDGVANGVRVEDGRVVLERSRHRDFALQNYFRQLGLPGSDSFIPEAAQNYLARATELKEAGEKLKKLVSSPDGKPEHEGVVVVGFWEDLPTFTKGSAYGTVYQEGFANTGVNTGDNRPVQAVFHEALESIATSKDYYVNEQTDPQKFANRILSTVAQALVKEDVSGNFKVTEGYTVDSVTINDKKVVDEVVNPDKEVRGKIEQTGQDVVISVPESVFNPGNNKFDYELKRVEDAPNVAEEDEVEPDDDYVPQKKTVEVGQLTGTFKVGNYETTTIGSKIPTSVEVTDLKYCYPNVTKTITDQDSSNDIGELKGYPEGAIRPSYAANLTESSEDFKYAISYRMNNLPLSVAKNLMLVDALDYRLEYKNAYVTDATGVRTGFEVKTKEVDDLFTGEKQTVVYAVIPPKAGDTSDPNINEGPYGGHKFARYVLHIDAKIKDAYLFENNPDAYKALIQDNDGYGVLNQAKIIWDGQDDDPMDENALNRRSNAVYVVPPVVTDIKKDVQSVEGTGEGYIKEQTQLNLAQRSQEYFYNVESTWPGLADSYILSDTLVPELEFVTAYGNGGAKITVNGKEVKSLTDKLVVTRNTVKLELTKADFTGRTIARQIATANKGNNGPAVIKLTIKAKIEDGADLSKYAVGGQIKVPNKAQVELNGKPQESNKVYVTPDEPAPSKKINSTLDVLNTTKSDEAFEFNIQTKLPRDIQKYQSYKISDKLDSRLELTNQPAPYIKGDVAQYFDVTYNAETHSVLATTKVAQLPSMTGGATVELVIPAKIKDGTAIEKIPNTATILYQTPTSGGEKETPPTPPVHVTPPPTIDKKVNNETHYNLTEATEAFTYTIETQVPDGATSFVISDKLVDVLEFDGEKGGATVQINGTDVTTATTITAENKTLEVALSADQLKNNVGQKVLVTFKAKVIEGSDLSNYTKEGVAKVPNTASYIINTDPKTKKETKPVTVTPPGETSEPQKTVNDQQSAQLSNLEEVFTYKVTAQVPTNTAGFTKFELRDDLEDILTVTETSATVGDATLDQKVTVTSPEEANTANGNVTASLSSNDIAKFAGKTVTLTIKARLKEGVTAEELAKYVTADNVAGSIPNRATLTVGDKPNQTKESENVPVTPPSETPSITKKINGNLEHLDTETAIDYSYNIKVKVPVDITSYKKFVIRDELNADLAIQGTPVISEPATQYFDVKVEGQLVTATMKNFAAAQELAGKEVELVIVSQIRKGVTTQNIPNTAEVVYQNRNHVEGTPDGKNDTPPVTVTPPGEDPTVEKKINRDLTEAVVLPESNYTYNITSTLPVDITSYKAYAIVDELDENLAIQGTPVMAKIDGVDMTQFFDVKVAGQKVTATMKNFENAAALAGKKVELVITAQVKSTSKAPKIDNTAKVTYQNKSHVDGTPDSETPPTPPVTVTPPPVTKKINETLDHLDTATKTNYNYNIKTVLPTDIASYKTFVINDDLDKDLEVQGTPIIKGDAAKFFRVTVDGQKVRATITDFNAAKAYAGKEVELVIVSQIREGVTRQAIPNQTTITYTNKVKAGGEPGDTTPTPPTPPVTVTPPGETPTVEKKINKDLTEATVLPESNYTYNITSLLPVDITRYKAYAIVDELDENLAIQGTPVMAKIDGVDMTQFFDVKVAGQKVTATMKNFKDAAALAGKKVELVITAQVKSTSKAPKIDNTAKVTYQNKNHVDGEPDSETPPTPPVTVTTPPVTKKINENLDHLDTATQTNYTYNIKTVLPTDIATYKRFVITDSLESELAVQGIPTMTGDAAKFFDVKVDGQVVTATITDFEAAKAMAGKEVELVIVSQIREGVTRQAIPNQTTITYTNKAKADGTPGDVTTTPPTPPVTVTPPGETPTVEKKINRDLTEAVVLPESNYTYNITSTLPVDITSYKAYAIVDELDENLSIQGTPVVTGDAAKFFDVTVTGNTVKATMKDFKQAKDLAGKQVELVITAQVKATSTAAKIDNTAKVTYQNKNHVDGEPDSETPPTPPVTVTTPPVTKKINENLDHLDTATQTNYTYNIKTVLPTDIATYKRFVITDSLESELAVQGIPTMTGDAAKFFDVKVDGQVVTATITDFEAAKAMAGKEVELVIVSQIREGVTRQAIPNQTTISYTNKAKADGTPGDVTTTPPTPPVTVTPPGETPTVEKKINRDLDHLDIETEKDYNYNITTNLPVDIVSYKRYVLTDTLDQDLAIQGTPVITGEAAKFFDVTVEGQTVTATMKDFKQAKDLAGKQVELVITAQVREGITRPNIPNTAKVEFTNKSDQTGEKETKPVTVTPPTPNTPPIEKKVNGAASAELASRQEVFTYTIDTVVPTGAFAFEVNDTLEDVLAFEGEVTATLAGKALSANQITVAGQTVTVKLTKEQVRQQAGAPLQVVFFAKVKDGADLTPYMTDGRTSVPNTASYIINNDPSTKKDSNTVPVYPPTPNEPSVDKKINRDLTHLDVEVNKSYMYNVTADLPQDIATYKEFVVTDIVEPVLAINGEVVAYVDGYATDAVKVTVEGNRVIASVVDFSRLAGFKQIQLYIPAYIKSDADLIAYMKDNAASIPNTASLDFTDSNGVKKRKETTPVTVTPPTPDTPPTPPVNPPQPGTPVKTVSRVAGLEQTDYLALLLATENFRFDIKSVVPMDEADDKRLNLTSLTITDQMDNLFTVSPDKVAVKVTNAPTANANYIDEDVEKAQAALDVEVAKLEEIKQSAQTDTSAAALTEAQNLLATLEAEWTAAEAKLAELTAANTVTTSSTPASTTAELTEAPVETPAVDYASEIAAQEALMAELQAKLDEAKTQVQTAQAALSTAKTAAEVKVEVENQEKVVAEKQTVLDEAKKRQAIVQERIAQLANVNEKGELTAQAIVALGGSIKVEGQLVTVDFTDEYTMEALKGYTVNVIIYSSISDVDALTKDHFTIGIDNTATVQFNHDPSEQLTKKTNKVTVVPPKNDTPPPPPTTPEKPKGELPTPPTPPTTPPAESTPPTPGKTLPKTGVAENGMYALVGMILGTLTLVFRRRKQ